MPKSKSTRQQAGSSPVDRPLPDRETLRQRIEAARSGFYDVIAIVGVCRAAAEHNADSDPDIEGALNVAERELLHLVADTIDPVKLLAPAEAREVANG